MGNAQRLTDSPYGQIPVSWHPSGKFLAFAELNPQTNFDLLILPMKGDEVSGWKPGNPTVFLNTRSDEREPTFSPDGRWIAYHSNESGRDEVYVRPYPGRAANGRSRPAVVCLQSGRGRRESSSSGLLCNKSWFRPMRWRATRFAPRSRGSGPTRVTRRAGAFRAFDLHPDGKRFALAPAAPAGVRQDHVTVIFNVFDELRRIAPNR